MKSVLLNDDVNTWEYAGIKSGFPKGTTLFYSDTFYSDTLLCYCVKLFLEIEGNYILQGQISQKDLGWLIDMNNYKLQAK